MQTTKAEFTLRLDKDLKEKLERLAAKDGRSLNNYINKLLISQVSK